MANVKITALPSLTGAASHSLDVIPVVDVSADTTSKMTRAEFFSNIPPITGNVGVEATLSAWSISGNIQLGSSKVVTGTGITYYSGNAYYDGAWKYISNTSATLYANGEGGKPGVGRGVK